jgi:hypothetical protein
LGIDFVERIADRSHQLDDGLLAPFQVAARGLLSLCEGGTGQVEEGLVVARQGVGGERFEGRLGFVLAPAKDQPLPRRNRR